MRIYFNRRGRGWRLEPLSVQGIEASSRSSAAREPWRGTVPIHMRSQNEYRKKARNGQKRFRQATVARFLRDMPPNIQQNSPQTKSVLRSKPKMIQFCSPQYARAHTHFNTSRQECAGSKSKDSIKKTVSLRVGWLLPYFKPLVLRSFPKLPKTT